ncbi:universal stress protein [Actinomadura sp. ATCC 31491]|uniref:Universal stress protein n=1 Tax=Actinomadura luzonensis TaxID=2805427 RepID=A0ABT0G460_9ACTN|nr:universal stress protein [Actinomadura luzonensis]MCK2218985.1 universal stress protein [Actinomadura luzonensis]
MTRHIMVGVDGSAPATAAVDWAVADAGGRGLALRLVHVCEQWPYGPDSIEYCEGTLAAAGDRARALDRGVQVTTDLLPGNVIETLIKESAAADTVVLGSRGLGGFAGLILGSVGMGLAGHAAGPVVIVRGPARARHDLVVVGDDGSEHSAVAVEYAIEQARARNAALHVVYAWQSPLMSPYAAAYNSLLEEDFQQAARAAAERVAPWREKNPDVRITDEQLPGHPVNALIKTGATADLVVVGSRGRGGFASAVLGSVSHAVLHHVTCPVAVIRPRHDGR